MDKRENKKRAQRVERAAELFRGGYNCSQSVFVAFADLYGIEPELALRLSASFGGGIGRMRETCGAACGLFLLAGLENGSAHAGDREGKSANYRLVQQLAAEFKARNGSCICRELLGLESDTPLSATASARTETYYKKRPCAQIVAEAAAIYDEYLTGKASAAKSGAGLSAAAPSEGSEPARDESGTQQTIK